jgi:hypothetical protein
MVEFQFISANVFSLLDSAESKHNLKSVSFPNTSINELFTEQDKLRFLYPNQKVFDQRPVIKVE